MADVNVKDNSKNSNDFVLEKPFTSQHLYLSAVIYPWHSSYFGSIEIPSLYRYHWANGRHLVWFGSRNTPLQESGTIRILHLEFGPFGNGNDDALPTKVQISLIRMTTTI